MTSRFFVVTIENDAFTQVPGRIQRCGTERTTRRLARIFVDFLTNAIVAKGMVAGKNRHGDGKDIVADRTLE